MNSLILFAISILTAASIAVSIVTGLAIVSNAAPVQPSLAIAASINTVKVCAVYDGGLGCGTGVFISSNSILTDFHIIAPITVMVPEYDKKGNGLVNFEERYPLCIIVLHYQDNQFQTASLISYNSGTDLAILKVDSGHGHSVVFTSEYAVGDSVTVVGNPGSKDFEVVQTKITAIYPLRRNGKIISMIQLDSKNNSIRPGFSGGGVFNSRGMIGTVEMCSSEAQNCLAIPGSELQKEINKSKREN